MSPKLSWPLPTWPQSKTGIVHLDWLPSPSFYFSPNRPIGTIDGEKTAHANLPSTLEGETLQPISQVVRHFVNMSDEVWATCTDTLGNANPSVLGARVRLLGPNPYLNPSSLQAKTSPAPPYTVVLPFARSRYAQQYLVFSKGTVQIKGQLNCQASNSDFEETLRVNLRLEPGWNGLTVRFMEDTSPNDSKFRLVLEGDASGLTLEP